MRLSRLNYDKPHRCPGWSGGGWKSAKHERCVENGGSVTTKTQDISWWITDDNAPRQCSTCGGDIVRMNPEFGFNTAWVSLSPAGTHWCPALDTECTKGGHRPALEYKYPSSDKWRFGYCCGSKGGYSWRDRTPGEGCGIVTLPYVTRWLDPTWYRIYVWRWKWRRS